MVKAAGELYLIISFICKRSREDVSILYLNFSPLSFFYTFSIFFFIAFYYIYSSSLA